MDLAGIINDGAEALHRGSVDKSSARPDLLTESRRVSENAISDDQPREPPIWARVHGGRRNKVEDVRRWKLAETRPELAEIFGNSPVPSKEREPNPPIKLETPFRFPPTRASDIGPGGNVSLTGLSASIAALVPNDDATKVFAGWLFENVGKIQDPSLFGCIEIEFKMGLIADDTDLRHKFPSISEAVVDPVYWRQKNLKFKTEIDERSFRALESLLDSLEIANSSNEQNVITKSNQLMTDSVYSVPQGDGKLRVRVSRDERGRVVECISKKRRGDLFMSLPNSPYDLKVSVSTEEPVDFERAVEPHIRDMPSSFERNKNRLKYTTNGCTIDLTSVRSVGTHGSTQVLKEGEVEANMQLLGQIIDEYHNSSNKAESLDKFLELVRYTVDSARFLLRNI